MTISIARRIGKAALLATLALGFVAASALRHDSARAAEKISMGVIGTGSAQQWALWIADKKGFFTENGLELDIVVTPSAAAVMQQILAGSIQIGSAGLTSPVRAIDQGIAVAVLAIETQAAPYSIWAKPALKSMSELKGRTIILFHAAFYTCPRQAERDNLKTIADSFDVSLGFDYRRCTRWHRVKAN